jgi:Ala-tRNA(Pro) deacylase
MPARKLKEFLDSNGIKYLTIRHSPAFTAQEVAEAAHIHGQQMAKVVMLKVEGKMAMAVVGADHLVDIPQIQKAAGTTDILLADENEFKNLFPGVETGAMPPFGNLFGMDVYAAKSLVKNREIVFNAGTHTELIRMSYADFERLVKPKLF